MVILTISIIVCTIDIVPPTAAMLLCILNMVNSNSDPFHRLYAILSLLCHTLFTKLMNITNSDFKNLSILLATVDFTQKGEKYAPPIAINCSTQLLTLSKQQQHRKTLQKNTTECHYAVPPDTASTFRPNQITKHLYYELLHQYERFSLPIGPSKPLIIPIWTTKRFHKLYMVHQRPSLL